MATLASLVVKITGDTGQLIASLDKADAKAQGFGAKIGKLAPLAATGLGAVAAGAVAGGAGLLKLGMSFDSAFDKIQTKTGATGQALDGLQQSFRNVFGSLPTDMETASTAIGELSQRTNATGAPLEGMAKNIIELSRLTGSDLSTNITSVTRAMGDWGITNEDGAKFMDKLFVASQKTGVGISSLADNLVKYGAPLRQMGFSNDEAIATLAKFEKEGVNTELVMGSLRIALGKMAKGGEPAIETFKRVVGEIKSAGTTSEANAKALELFGSRAGPDMAAAIREGRFELGSLIDDLGKSDNAILDTAKQTEDFGEKWTRLKNKIMLALEPLATRALDTLNKLADVVEMKIAPALQEWYQRHQPAIEAKLKEFQRIMEQDIQPAVERFAELVEEWWPRIEPIVKLIVEQFINRILTSLEIMFDTINILLAVFQGDWGAAWNGIKKLVGDIWDGIVSDISLKLAFLKIAAQTVWDAISGGASAAFGAAEGVIGRVFTSIRNTIADVILYIKQALDALPGPNPAGNALQRAADSIRSGPAAAPGPSVPAPRSEIGDQTPGGFFALGTPFVQRDMLAMLHRGERVLTAADNRRFTTQALTGGGGGGNIAYMTFNVSGDPGDAGARRIAREVKKVLREELGFSSIGGALTPLSGFSP